MQALFPASHKTMTKNSVSKITLFFPASFFFFMLLILFLFPSFVYAGPALSRTNTYTQPDGSAFEVILYGDEYFSYYQKPDGTLLQEDSDGFFKQVFVSDNGTLAFGARADEVSDASAAKADIFESDDMRTAYYALAGKTYQESDTRTYPDLVTIDDISTNNAYNSPGLNAAEVTEKKVPLITIVISFSDQEADSSYDWSSELFTGGSSLSAYYKKSSEDKFTWENAAETSSASGGTLNPNSPTVDKANDGIIYVKLDKKYPDFSADGIEEECFTAALDEASDYIDFSTFDTNKNGTIENNEAGLLFVVAGYEASANSEALHKIWGHTANFPAAVTEDKTQISLYTTIGEKWDINKSTMQAGIGIIAHELGHYLGLPDLYDTTNKRDGAWKFYDVLDTSLMSGGSWGMDSDNNYIPTYLDPYCRQLLGYISPNVITSNGTFTAESEESKTDGYTAYRINISENEYYLIENRQYGGFDRGLEYSYKYTNDTGGIIIWHIDNGVCKERSITVEDEDKNNTTNTTDHRPGVMPNYPLGSDGNPLCYYPFMNNVINEALGIAQIPLTEYNGSDEISEIADTGITLSVNSVASDEMTFTVNFPSSITPENKGLNANGEAVAYNVTGTYSNIPMLKVFDATGKPISDSWASATCESAGEGTYTASITFPKNATSLPINYTIHIFDGEKEADSSVFASISQGIRCDDVLNSGSEGSVFKIYSALRGVRMVDISGASTANGANAQIYTNNETAAQRFLFTYDDEGFYTIKNVYSGKVLDAAGGGKTNGTNVQQYVSNNTDAQKWVLYPVDGHEGYYCILNRASGLALDVAGGNAADGANLQLYSQNETAAQHFTFVTGLSDKINEDTSYSLISALSSKKAADIAAASKVNGGNLQLYNDNGTNAQKFSFKYDTSTGYYTLINVNSSLVIDVSGGSKDNMANVWQYASNGTFAQKWAVVSNSDGTITLINAGSGKALDIAGAQTANGTNIQQYTSNGTNAQKWHASGEVT